MAELTPDAEARRLRVLASYAILDTPAEAEFDDLTRLAADICETPVALISLVDARRQWFKSRVGLDFDQIPREIGFCAQALASPALLEVGDAARDPRFAANPLVTGEPGIRFYAGAPLQTPEGEVLGALCVIDHRPRRLSELQRRTLAVLSRQVMQQLQLRRQLREQMRVEAHLRESEQNMRNAQRIAHLGSWEVDLASNRLTWSEEVYRIFGVDPQNFRPSYAALAERVPADALAQMAEQRHRTLRDGTPSEIEHRVMRPDGEIRHVRERSELVVDAAGQPQRLAGTVLDITELKQAELALQESGTLLGIASAAARIGGWKLDLTSGRVIWSDTVRRIHGVAPDYEPTLATALAFHAPGYRDQVRAAVDACMADGTPFDLETEFVSARGQRLWVRVIGRAARDDSGLICAIQGAFQDISERKRSEAEIHQLGERLQAALENITDAFVTFDRDWRVTYMNAEAERLLQRRREDLLGRGVWDELDPERQTRSFEQYHRAATTGSTVSFTEFYTPLNMWFEITAYPGPDGLAVYFRDVNAKVEQERQLHQQALLLDQATDAILVRDLDHRIRFWNRAAERLYGWRSGEVIGRSIAALLYPDDASQFEQATRQVLRGGEWTGRLRQRRRDGSAVTVEGHWTLVKDEQGRPQSILAINTDISGRLDLEERLAQAQKLESIGQLTGGVAHDFNNLLTVIIGNAELLGEAIGEGSRLTPIIDLVRTAADRGAELTSRLLAFARRQALEPKVVSPQAIVDGMAPLLRRTLGESVEVELFHEPDLWQAFIDPVQLESALLNLCINARDAMPGGGKLTIDTANVILDDTYAALHAEMVPGPYVQVAVSDTGSGIAPDDVAYVFEPFFTTKEKGKGTGLGLSMVYGFVKQSGGHIKLYSEQGHGTTVHIYLPRVQAGDRDVDEPRPPAGELYGDEHILLVEDDELVRSHAARLLGDLGYRVTIAANGPQALALLQQGLQVDLLFTDVIMPGGLNGPQLAAEAKKLAPDLPVLYTSGYTENAIVHHGRVDPGTVLLQKPYRRQALAEKIRQALAAPSAPSGTSSPERGPNNG